MKVFILQHIHTFDDGEENVKILGVYSNKELAEAAINRLSVQPGFRDTVNGFDISWYEVDKDHWTEGYITITSSE